MHHIPHRTPREPVSTDDALTLYLRDIGVYPLIDRAEEARLARRIRAGDSEALDALVRANLRFVVSVAKRYRRQGVPLLDLIDEGNLGLIRAAHRFDERKGIRFISYAVWWIRQAILQALAEQSRVVRVPLNRTGTLHRIGREASSLLQELGREPTQGEIADGLAMPEREVANTMLLLRPQLSLEAPLRRGEDARLLDVLPDDDAPPTDEESERHALGRSLGAALSTLRPREVGILRLYFGLDGGEPLTLEQIGARLAITRERVRQIRDKALSRLRQGPHAAALASFAR